MGSDHPRAIRHLAAASAYTVLDMPLKPEAVELLPIANTSTTMEAKKDAVYVVDDDNVSSAEGQVDDTTAGYRPMPEVLREMSSDEIKKLNGKLVRKIDRVILPTIGILYILNYIDRQNLAAAKLQGITKDLNMTTQQFATSISILFVGYLPFQIPSNLLITKISRPGMYICLAVAIWGCISASTAAVKSYGQLLAVRAILGAAEAVFFPGAIYYLSAWYTKVGLESALPVFTLPSKSATPSVASLRQLSCSLTGSTTSLAGSGCLSSRAAPPSALV